MSVVALRVKISKSVLISGRNVYALQKVCVQYLCLIFIYLATNTAHVYQVVMPSRYYPIGEGARFNSVVRAFAHGAMDRRIDPS